MESSKWLTKKMVLLGFFLIIIIIMLGSVELCEGCLEEERLGLFRLKPFFPFIDVRINDLGILDSAVEEEKEISPDCCEWERIECNPITGRITHLFLNQSDTFSIYESAFEIVDVLEPENIENWYLNASLFLPFEELQTLSLTMNSIAGCIHNQGFEILSSKLDKLQILDLTLNAFNDSILVSLSELSSLRSLNLAFNQFTGSNLSNGINILSKLNNLEILDLSGNYNSEYNILSQLDGFTCLKSLRLQNCGLKGTIDMLEFDNLRNLKELYLGSNEIESLASSFHGGNELLRLNKLEVLDLSFNLINNSIFASLGVFSNLKSLYLDYNQLKGPIHVQDALIRLPNLKILSFGDFELEGPIDINELDGLSNLEELNIYCYSGCSISLQPFGLFSSLKTLSLNGFSFNETTLTSNQKNPLPLKNLESLNIEDCTSSSIGSNFLQEIGAMPSIKFLRIRNSGLNDTLYTKGFCGSTNLQELVLTNNNLKGNLSECFSNFTSLERLNLSNNQFSGDISTLKALTSLKILDLSFNQFSGNVNGLKSLISLESLDLSSNRFSGNVNDLKSLTSLESLDLSSNQFSGNITDLKSLTSLKELDLSNNYFQIPGSLSPFFNLSKLKGINASNNTIYAESEIQSLVPRFQLREISLSCCGDVGQLPQFLYHQRDLRVVDISNVNLKGEFPSWLLQNNTNLERLVLANNSLLGPLELPSLPQTILFVLDISENFFYHKIPNEIGTKLPWLQFLNLSKNHFHGNIPASVGDMSSLSALDLSNNELSGEIPRRMTENMLSLSTLDLSYNEFSGEIPRWTRNVSGLSKIMMANNHLQGPIPIEFCNLQSLELLDLSVNNISGSLPSCFISPLGISQVHLSRNKLEGPITDVFRNSTILVTLDLSYNQLTGKIPNWIGNLPQLSYVLLNNNRFEGRIPTQLCNLGHLSLLDLSNNNLSGTIPPCLKITTLNEISQDFDSYVRHVAQVNASFSIDEPIQFTSKNNSYSYKGRVLTLLSGIDLSCNKLTGEIPQSVKDFKNIYALNLSHNMLTGPIPLEFSELKQIESLDLSHNNLSGKIPRQLTVLFSLSYFSVAYNNLSGSTPDLTAQFSTFDESSYVGNPFLCGKPLSKSCSTSEPSPPLLPKASDDEGFMDMTAFYASFVVSFVMVILTIASVLYINPYWRRAWLYHIGEISTRCYYFLEDHILPRRFC